MKTKCTSKILSLILVMLMLIGMTPAVVSAAQTGETKDGFKYSISNGKVTITGYTGDSKVVNIPEKIDNCPVTKVSSYAFIDNCDITVVVYPEGVTTVEAISFANCKSLQSIHLPDTVTTIGSSAFFGCTKLVNISIPKNVEVIDNSAFQKCESLTNITLPDSVKSIGGQAFAECTKLKSIIIPEGITTIAESTFEKCTSLKSIKIPASVTSIDQRAFYYCSSLADVYYPKAKIKWNEIEVGDYNYNLTKAEIHCKVKPDIDFDIDAEGIAEDMVLHFDTISNGEEELWDDVWVYCWGDYGEYAPWPGIKMTCVERGLYVVTLPAGTKAVAFNDNNGNYSVVSTWFSEYEDWDYREYEIHDRIYDDEGAWRLTFGASKCRVDPEVPETTVDPSVPEVPETTVDPSMPEVPETTVDPSEPEVPETTVAPSEPEVPVTTVDPSVPEEPTIPEFTDSPETVPNPAPIKGKLKVEVEGGTGFSISVNGGVAKPQGLYYINTKMTVGTSVTLVAKSSASSEFYGWVNGSGKLVSESEIYTFVTSGDDTLKAVYIEDVVGVNSVSFVNEKAAGGRGQVISMQYYAADDTIVFPATPVQVGYDFAGWSMTEADIQRELSKGKDVTVTANWTIAKVYVNLTVNGGKITYGNLTDGKALAYNGYGVTADTSPAGKRFAYWVDATGRVMSYDTEFKFYPATDIELTAVYVDENNEPEYEALVTIVANPTVEGEKIAYTLSWDVSHVGEIVAAGITLTNEADYNENTLYHGTDDKAVFDRALSQYLLADNHTYTVVKASSYYENTYAARAWVVYKDATGTNHTVHSDVIMVYKPAP